MSEQKINLKTIPGIEEMSDCAAESLSGGISQSALQKAKNDAINLYGQVQKAAIDYEFATAEAKLAKDKAKSISV